MYRLRRPGVVALLLGSLALPALLTAQSGGKGTQYALLVACSRYEKAEFKQLPFTGNDVELFRQALLATGFAADHVLLVYDGAAKRQHLPEKQKILDALDFVLDGLRPEDTLVVALSGHGLQYKGDPVSYFVPVDGRVNDRDSLIALGGKGGLYEKVKSCKARRKVLFVNACRNNPTVGVDFANSKALLDEDRPGEVPEGMAALYSCSAGQKSYYDPERKIALFFEHLIRAWKGEYSPGTAVTLDEVFRQVCVKTKDDAYHRYDAKQVPFPYREYQGDWVITAVAKPPVPKPPSPPADKGVSRALLVGCTKYAPGEGADAPCSGNDVRGFRDALQATGFDDVLVMDDDGPGAGSAPTRKAILGELDRFLQRLGPEDTAVVALSGHGVQFRGGSVVYFAPADGRVPDRDTLIPMSGPGGLYERLRASRARKKLLIVNCPRTDPTVGLGGGGRKIEIYVPPEVAEGIVAFYSCRAGQQSHNDPKSKRSIFFDYLIRGWQGEYAGGKAVKLEDVLDVVARKTSMDINRLFSRLQTPEVVRDYGGDWVITAAAKPPASKPTPLAAEVPPAKADTGIVAEMKFVPIPKGTFWMGWDSKKRQSRQVTIDHDFELAAYCVTQGQWQQVMGNNPSSFSRQGRLKDYVKDIKDADLARFPVEKVSWDDAQEFIKKVNAQEGGKGWVYRLPKEAEWEYACRNAAKSKEECSFDFYLQTGTNYLSSTQANIHGDYLGGNEAKEPDLGRPQPVGSYPANKLGLYDMHGNVAQWCEDLDARGADRVVRGGCWFFSRELCRAASCHMCTPSNRESLLGFRLARVRAGG